MHASKYVRQLFLLPVLALAISACSTEENFGIEEIFFGESAGLGNVPEGFISALEFNYDCSHFVDSVNGDDANDGTSEVSAWKTFDRVSQESREIGFNPGNAVCFKRGQRFLVTNPTLGEGSSGLPGDFVYYGSYGDPLEPLPRLSPSLNISRLDTWANLVDKIVRTPNEWVDAGNGIYKWGNDHVSWSPSKLWSDSTILTRASNAALTDGDWFFARDDGLYYRPADGISPDQSSAEIYLDIKNSIIGAHQTSNLVIADLAFEYAGNGIVNDVLPSGQAGPAVVVENFVVVNSTFRNMNIPIEVRSREYNGTYYQPSNLVFIGNAMTDIGAFGIRLESKNGPSGFNDVYIEGNSISNIAVNGAHLPGNAHDIEVITLQNASNVLILNNRIVNGLKEADGVCCRSIDGRNYYSSGIIVFRHADRVLQNILIDGNFVTNISQGIVVGTGPTDMNRGIVISNNIVAESDFGIKTQGKDTSNSSFVVNNTLYRNLVNFTAAPFKGQGMIGNLSVNPLNFHIVINSFGGTSDANYNAYYPDGALFKADNINPSLVRVFDSFNEWQLFSVTPDVGGMAGSDPQFTNSVPVVAEDFKLAQTSSARDLVPAAYSAISVDFENRDRMTDFFIDAGAWERLPGD